MRDKALPVTDRGEVAKILDVQVMQGQSLKFKCAKCTHNTSGVIDPEETDLSKCPACSSVLIYCPVCRDTSSCTRKYRVLICDRCHTDFVTDRTITDLAKRESGSAQIVLSGIRATGALHLGNYFGAVQQFVKYAGGDNLSLYFIADWHTLTTFTDADAIRSNVLAVATDYLAAGLDPEQSIIYAQSSVPEIAELALYLGMFQGKAQLEDLPTVKDLVKDRTITLGHLSYPVLMAADILAVQATLVPVGLDQRSNIETARDLARKFNRQFGHTFTVPEMAVQAVKIPGLRGGKMGKSEAHDGVSIVDDRATIIRKYSQGVTDATRVHANDPGHPEACVSVYPVFETALSGSDPVRLADIAATCRAGTRGCRDCKLELANALADVLAPFQERRRKLADRQDYVREVLHYGGMMAREIVQPTLELVRQKLGIGRF